MNPVLRNILAVLAGAVTGGVVNMALITIGPSVIAPPDGVDMTTAEGLVKGMSLMQPKHFIMPFLAHALGSLAGAWVGAMIAVNKKMAIALGLGAWFILGGIGAAFMIPAPVWFIVIDLLLAYLPMAYLAGRLSKK